MGQELSGDRKGSGSGKESSFAVSEAVPCCEYTTFLHHISPRWTEHRERVSPMRCVCWDFDSLDCWEFQYRNRVSPHAARNLTQVIFTYSMFQYRNRVSSHAARKNSEMLNQYIRFQYRNRVSPHAAGKV